MNNLYTPIIKRQSSHRAFRALAMVSMMLFFAINHAQAQGCYGESRSSGIAAMQKKQYDKAIQWFNAAKGCDDKPANNDLDAKIKECQDLKAKAAKDKKDAEDKRRKKEEEARIREEQERLQREYEEEQERQMARTAYMQITRVDFVNVDQNGIQQPNSGILYWQDIKYIKPVIHYNGLLDEETRSTTLYCKIYKPNSSYCMTWDDSPQGYSYSYPMTVEPGYNNEQTLTSWGSQNSSTFTQGTYTFEIYNQEGELLDTRQFIVMDKPPTTVDVTFVVDDNDAEIYVNNGYKGKGRASMSLEIGKTYGVETRKKSHTSPYVSIIAEKNMSKTYKLANPEPIYGSLSINASKKDVNVYLDGVSKGTAPLYFNQILIGEHKVKMTKNKFNDYTETVSIKANQQSSVNAEMQRSQKPWIIRKADNFSSVFINSVYAFDYGFTFEELGSVGGNFTYCGSHLGFFVQYLHGIRNKNQSFSGGLVLRLTNRAVDVQLLAGPAFNLYKYTIYDDNYSYNYTSNSWMGNVGMRLSWQSRWKLALWDLTGGVMFNANQRIPYVGMGLGTSIAGGLAALGVYLKYYK